MNIHDNKCFQYAATVTLNHKEIRKILLAYQKLNFLQINVTVKR